MGEDHVCEGCDEEVSEVFSGDGVRFLCSGCFFGRAVVGPRSGDFGSRVLVVGECVPEGHDREEALAAGRPGSIGNRLMNILGMSERNFASRLERVNLCSGGWNREEARDSAEWLVGEFSRLPYFLLLGRRVREAFGGESSYVRVGRSCYLGYRVSEDLTIVGIPHPSGRCREWNDARTVVEVRRFLSAVVRDFPWGVRGAVR